jgi:hypothetical protein
MLQQYQQKKRYWQHCSTSSHSQQQQQWHLADKSGVQVCMAVWLPGVITLAPHQGAAASVAQTAAQAAAKLTACNSNTISSSICVHHATATHTTPAQAQTHRQACHFPRILFLRHCCFTGHEPPPVSSHSHSSARSHTAGRCTSGCTLIF